MTFLNTLESVLRQDERLVAENGYVMKNKAYDMGVVGDSNLLKLLLSNSDTRRHFFKDVDGVMVFDSMKFGWTVTSKEFLPDSYTRYKNKIGLVDNSGLNIVQSKDVCLVWPYKDCVLEGGQIKEDQKRNEIFYNETLAPDEINRLLYPKVFTNAKRFEDGKESSTTTFDVNSNLIIKGNNLLAISSLLKKYEGKIKCIYIDPPYNTHSAANTFAYNNSFNQSTWLTFMKNRLEFAKKLLSPDGLIICAIDHNELCYLGVLMDEIFGVENQMGILAVVHNPGGRQDEKFFPTAHENMLVYANDITRVKINNLPPSEEKLKEYKLSDECGNYKLRGFRRSGNNSRRTERPALYYEIFVDPISQKISLENFYGAVRILPIDDSGIERCWRWGPETLLAKKDKYLEIKNVNGKIDLYIKERESDYQGERPKTIWDKSIYSGQTATNELKKLLGNNAFSYPKSIYLMIDVLYVATNKDDVVLDFFGGSGTTAHAVMALNKRDGGNRRFILCEQMNYAEDVTYKRAKIVSNLVSSKIAITYCELAQLNEKFLDAIQKTTNDVELEELHSNILKNGFINYKMFIPEIKQFDSSFSLLSFDDKRHFLLELLDKNMLYVNLCDIDDADFNITEEDKSFTNNFYGRS